MASLIISNVTESSVDVTYEYLEAEELFGYTVKGSYLVNISDINLQQEDTVLLKGRDAIKSAYGRPNIVARIGADDYLNGQIESYSFGESSLVGSESVTISIQEFRRLDSYAASQFAKYIPNPHTISSFNESYSFSRSGATYSSQRKVSITYKQEAGGQFLNNAKTFLTNYYFANRPSLGYQEDGISENAKIDKNYRGLISEKYDLIGLSVELNEKVDSSFVDDSLSVSRQQTERIELTEQGYKNKTRTINLTSLRLGSENALTNAMAEIVEEIKTTEHGEFGDPFKISKGITKDGNNATLTISFTTDPKKSQDDTESYSGSEAKAGRFREFTLSIEYKSTGPNNREKFLNSKKIWVEGQSLNKERIQRLFHPPETIYEKSRSTDFQKTEGVVRENIVFTTDDSYKDTDDGVLKVKTTLSKSHQIPRFTRFLELNSLEEAIVVRDLKVVGQASVKAELVASQSMGIYKAQEALESRTDEFTALVDENITHITSDTISLSLGQGTAMRTLNYLYLEDG